MDWENNDDFYEVPRKPGCARVFMHKDFLKPEVRAEIERNASLLDINLVAPNLEAAKSMCKNWPDKSREIYAKIMEELL